MDIRRRFGWCSGSVCAWAVAVTAASQVGCSSSSHEDVGAVRVAITAVPGDVLCMQITAQATRTVFQQFNVIPGDSPVLQMSGLPLGDTRFTAAAFASRCGTDNLTPSPTWVSDPMVATIVQNVVAEIALVMHRNGRASISIDFPDDPTCVPEGAACGACCPGTRCDAATGLCAACVSDGEACDPTQLCCGGLACTTGVCGEPPPCVADGLTCDGTSPCCSSGVECLGGTCGGCVADGTACDGRQPCCSGVDCTSGTCGGCVADGVSCDGGLPCCSGVQCTSGTCGGPMCVTEGTACGGLLQCCMGLSCNSGNCEAPMPCDAGQHVVSDGSCRPILFSDDFEDGVVSPALAVMRKTFIERDGRMYVGDNPRPGFNYGHSGNGRDAILATHIGDATWTDYRLDLDIAVDSPGAFNPFGLLPCTRLMIINVRVQELQESWNQPAETDYGIGVDLDDCDPTFRQTVGFGAQQHLYQNGIGCCDTVGRSRSFINAVPAPANINGGNHYAVEVVGNNIKLWINSNPIFDYTDDKVPLLPGEAPITHGGIAIQWVWELIGWVDNVVVTDLR